ncbi:MAG: hypothetical protein Q9207_007920 [Kuettlingeria erythrocarpa]
MVIVSPLFYLFGGSVSVMNTNFFAIVTDVAMDDINRTQMMGYIQSASQVVQLLAPSLAAATMEKNLYIPFWIGIAAVGIAIFTNALIPETRHPSVYSPLDASDTPAERESLITSDVDDSIEESNVVDTEADETSGSKSRSHDLFRRLKTQALEEYHDFATLIKKSNNICLSMVAFLVTQLAKTSLNILLQYVSKRYNLTIAMAAYLFSIKAGVNLLLFSTIIPVCLGLSTEYTKLSKINANLWGARISLALLAVGSTAIGLSSKIWLLILMLTHATFAVLDKEHTARIYSAMGVVENVGSLIGAPVLSGIWAAAINIGEQVSNEKRIECPWQFTSAAPSHKLTHNV